MIFSIQTLLRGVSMITAGDVINDTYLIDCEIGSGALGVVYKAYHLRLQKYVVLKRIKVDKVSYSRFRVEVDTLKSLRHAYLPNVYDYLEYNDSVYTVMDYIDGYDLKHLMENGYRFSQEELIKWLRQLCSVLNYLHNNNPPVIHSDIKPDNILIDQNGNVCLIDFNIAGGQGLTKEYASPEQFDWFVMKMSGYPQADMYQIDSRSDLYSLGAVFYYLMTGVTPNVQWTDMPALASYHDLPYSEALTEIVEKLKCRDLNNRFQTCAEVLGALDNIKKSDSRYKRYILMQVIGAVIFVLLLVVGVRMILVGTSMVLFDEYTQSYNQVAQIFKSGDYDQAINKGNEFLNSSKYKKIRTEKEIAEVYYIMGNSAYNCEDYSSAVAYFSKAYKLKDHLENKMDLYIDFAVTLAQNDQLDDAQRLIDEANSQGITGSVLLLANAEISFIKGNDALAMQQAEECLNNSIDNNKTFRCYLLIAKIYEKNKDHLNSISYCRKALDIEENPDLLRRLAKEYTALSEKYSEHDAQKMECLRNAETYLHKVYSKYTPDLSDHINLGALNRTLGNYDFSVSVLNDGIKRYGNQCRIFLNLALTYGKMGNNQAAADSIAKAMQFADETLTEAEKRDLQSVYNAYF